MHIARGTQGGRGMPIKFNKKSHKVHQKEMKGVEKMFGEAHHVKCICGLVV